MPPENAPDQNPNTPPPASPVPASNPPPPPVQAPTPPPATQTVATGELTERIGSLEDELAQTIADRDVARTERGNEASRVKKLEMDIAALQDKLAQAQAQLQAAAPAPAPRDTKKKKGWLEGAFILGDD
jgi:uncharacterized small protein (DUF1192 family)